MYLWNKLLQLKAISLAVFSVRDFFCTCSKNISNLKVYPNPINKSEIFVECFVEHDQEIHVGLYDVLGKLIAQWNHSTFQGANKLQLNFGNEVVKGTYSLKITGANYSGTVKIIKL